MNRICLKRKEMQKKSTAPIPISSENTTPTELEDLSNSQTKTLKREDNGRVLEEFHAQYEALRLQYEELRKAYDDSTREKKRVEIQLMNANPEYYQKEINRLKIEVEKLQEENQEYKHTYFVAENSKKELESTVRVKSEELKRCLQQLEKEKIQAVEYKHQLTQKEKFYQRMIGEMEKSTEVLSTNFEELTKRANKLEIQLKTKEKDLQESLKNLDSATRQNIQNQNLMKKNKEIYDQTNFKKTQMIQQLESKLRGLDRASRDTIEGLQLKIDQYSNYRKTQNLFMNQRIESTANLKIIRQNELQVVRLEEISKQLKLDLEDRNKLIKMLEEKLLGWFSPQQYRELEEKFEETDRKRFEAAKYYEGKLLKMQKEHQVIKMNALRNPAEEAFGNQEFQELLKCQVSQNTKMKKELSAKVDELYSVRTEIEEMKCKLKCSEDQIALLNKKLKSQQKNNKIQVQVSSQNLKNQIDSLKRKLETINNKLEGKVKEVKEKENFIINTIIGRSRQEDVPFIVSEFQRIFETEYSNKLSAALEKIAKLEKQV